MKIITERFGELEYTEEDIIRFEKGIPGFEECTQFLLFPFDPQSDQRKEMDSPYFFLQSIEEAHLCFLLLDTYSMLPDYRIEVDDRTVEQLHIEQRQDVLVLTTVTIKDSIQQATTNLRAPIIINARNNRAKQILIDDEQYGIKHPLFNSSPSPQKVTKG